MNVGVQSFLLVKKPQNQGHVANPAKIKEAKFQQHNRKSLYERQDRKYKIPRKSWEVNGFYMNLQDVSWCSRLFYLFLGFFWVPFCKCHENTGPPGTTAAWLPKTRPLLTAIGPEAAEVDSDVIAGDTTRNFVKHHQIQICSKHFRGLVNTALIPLPFE